ncbi:right-handed parallel beta-helix repeat-containing protein [Microvirga sp. HBU67558]|uniref:right-handed parallel beta-helix repeat-containing protein n=1 Tax=Microvirga TaxID=186650 RepID=UPI001B37F7E0|nr:MULTISPECIES: right-handed parallel beta-helix repeat-containing protein [unclassified Microvirga]MBQ0822441.1 right-handed parallel beta-helix repeat-containing protein [Microvirga sp. HBU67558]
MTASSRSEGRRRLRMASLLLSMALASSAMAQDGSEVTRLADEARQAFVAAEQGGVSAKQKAAFYQVVRARLKLLEKFAGQGTSGSGEFREGAREQLTRLADEGLNHDMVGAMLLQASIGDLVGIQSGPDRVEAGVALHQLAGEQRSPAYRAAAFVAIANAYARVGFQDRAVRYVSLALATIDLVSEAGQRAGILNAVSRIASGIGAPGIALANRTIGLMPASSSRAYARQVMARDQLKGTPLEKAPDAKLKVEAKKRTAMGDLSAGLSLALAMQDGRERDDALSASLEAAVERRDRDVSLAAAQGFFDSSRQEAALAVIVKNDVDRGTPLRAAELVNSLEDGHGKAALQITVAAALKEAGYDRMAERISTGASAVNPSLGRATEPGDMTHQAGPGKNDRRTDELMILSEIRGLIEQKRRTLVPDAALAASLRRIANHDDRAAIALELATLPDTGVSAADLVRSLEDDRSRAKTFRRLAEIRADHLMKPLSDEPGENGDGAGASAPALDEESQELQTRRGLALIRLDAPQTASAPVLIPSQFETSAAVRSNTPWPGGAVVGSTFARHNPYIAKFLDDDESGVTRLEQAVRYQGLPSPRIVVVQSGTATLGMVARQLQGTDARDLIVQDGDAIVVRAPVFVAPGATLILSHLDAPVYRLSATAGAFIANAGQVDIVDADVVGYDEKTGQPSWSDSEKSGLFRPFLLTWGDGRMNVASSVLAALGYDNVKSFGLTYSSGPDQVANVRDQARPTGTIVDNVFRNLYIGFHSFEAERLQVVGNEFRDSIVYAVDAHDGSKGNIIAFNTVYGTMVRHGIAVSRDAEDNLIVGNLSFDNAGSGIVLDRNSTDNVLNANSSFQNMQDGVTVFESSCNVLTNNHLAGNRRDGLKVRNSFDVGAYGNRIEANSNSGVSAYIASLPSSKRGDGQGEGSGRYAPVTSLSLRNNSFSSNGVGINTQGVSGLTMFSNRFVKQSRRLLGGDIRGLEGPVLRLAFQSDVLIASTCRPAKPVSSCRLRDLGYLEGDADRQIFNSQAGSDCTDINGSVQHRAFSSSSQGT